MNESPFEFENIPDFVLHDAVRETLGSCNLVGGSGGTNYNFRCPICGDSKTRTYLRRGFILTNQETWVYYCQNECGSMAFTSYLKEYHPEVFRRVIFHALKEKTKFVHKEKKVVEKSSKYLGTEYKFKDGELLSVMDTDPLCEIALTECKRRKIPESVYKTWYVCIKDDYFTNKDELGYVLLDERGIPTGNEYGNRLIIPYYKLGGKWSQFDARALSSKMMLRYKNIKDTQRELYKADWLDTTKPFYLLEGAIDSCFIKNSVAFGGTKHLHRYLEEYPKMNTNSSNGTIIWDNDDAGVFELMSNLDLGFKYFDWLMITVKDEFKFKTDGTLREIKDINDFVLYSNECVLDKDGFIEHSCLTPYIKNSEGSKIRLIQQYGNRIEDRKKKLFEKKKYNTTKTQDFCAF